MSNNSIQRTLVVFKPDAVSRGLVGEITTRFERVGLKIVATKMASPDRDHYDTHYEAIGGLRTRRGDKAFELALDLMMRGPVVATVLEGVEAVELVRKLVGPTEPKSAQPGTIRGDYSHMSFGHADEAGVGIPNLIHASGDADEAAKEISHWFAPGELYDYEATHERFTR